jgi:hypothetical protein
MATKAKTTKKTVSKKTSRKGLPQESGNLAAATAALFGGGAVALIGTLQRNDDIKLLLVGFGAALLVLGGVLVGMSTKPRKKK